MEIQQRLSDLREVMRREKLDAFIFPGGDPHGSEYVPERWEGRRWISGFDGSSGTAVVTQESAALWTDSRYFLSAEAQLEGTEFQLMRLGMPETPTITQWIGAELRKTDGTAVGVDGMVMPADEVSALIAELRREGGITVRTNLDILEAVWAGRPPIPSNPVTIHPMVYAGEPTTSKLARIRQALRAVHADGMLVSALDDVAWTLNLRGTDVHCNPVFVAYLLIDSRRATLYCRGEKLSPEVREYLAAQGVDTADYEEVGNGLKNYFEYNILLDPHRTSYTLSKKVDTKEVVWHASPIPALKAVKNQAEIEGFREAMVRDGIAMVQFLRWLGPAVEAGGETECSVSRKLKALRALQPLYRGDSFDTIAGYGEHGAIVHYEPTPATDAPLAPRGFLLLDSGAQYENGTTDITRTIPLGPLTDEQQRVYTLVLKGHIQLELCKFPQGASGTQLDALARAALWREGMNYLHGTGHGVGSYLNVHEGPHQIRMEYVAAPLLPGMTVTDEPGLYLPGRFGVRIENTLLIVPYKETEFGRFLQFESLTLCPIDTTPILRELMLPEEVAWLNDYHRRVFETLSPHLNNEERAWLRQATTEIA